MPNISQIAPRYLRNLFPSNPSTRNFLLDAVCALLAVLVAFCTFWHALGFSLLNFHVPLVYASDALGLFYIYDIAQRGAIGAPGDTGMPFGTTLYDAPNSDAINLFIIQGYDVVSGEFGTAFNLFYITTIVLNGLAAYAVGRKLGLARHWACALSILFNLIPFHLLRVHHIFYVNFLPAILATWLASDVIYDTDTTAQKSKAGWVLILLAAIVCGACGIYYAFFSCLFIGSATVIAFCAAPRRATATRGAIVVSVIILTVAANLLPSIQYRWENGANTKAIARGSNESEFYGLKVAQLLLPASYHRIKPLADLRQAYDRSTPLNNENSTSTLGIVGSLGFLILLFAPFAGKIRERLPIVVTRIAPLAWIGFAYATIGGFGSLFAWAVTPDLRAPNRISTFIAFIALVCFMAIAQRLFSSNRNGQISILFAVLISIVGILDQTPAQPLFAGSYAEYETAFRSDRAFGTQIEQQLPEGSMLFQLPFKEFPESGPLVSLSDYELLTPILFAKHLRWTFGAMKGREESNWYKLAASFSPKQMIDVLQATGFRGVVLNRKGYPDHAAALEQSLVQLGLQPQVTSPDTTTVFYPFASYATAEQMAFAVAPGKGWNSPELSGTSAGIWSLGDADILVANIESTRKQCTLALRLSSVVPRNVSLWDGPSKISEIELGRDAGDLTGAIRIEPGTKKRLLLKTNLPAVHAGNGDPRLLAFYWQMDAPPICR